MLPGCFQVFLARTPPSRPVGTASASRGAPDSEQPCALVRGLSWKNLECAPRRPLSCRRLARRKPQGGSRPGAEDRPASPFQEPAQGLRRVPAAPRVGRGCFQGCFSAPLQMGTEESGSPARLGTVGVSQFLLLSQMLGIPKGMTRGGNSSSRKRHQKDLICP